MSDVSVRAVSLISLRVAEVERPLSGDREWAVYACIRIHVGSDRVHRCWVCWSGPWRCRATAQDIARSDSRARIEARLLESVRSMPEWYLDREKPTEVGITGWAAGQSHRLAPKTSLGSPRRAEHEQTRKHLRAKRESNGFTDGARKLLADAGIPLED